MEKVLQELSWVHFFGHPYCLNGTKIHLDVALTTQCKIWNNVKFLINPLTSGVH